MSTIRPESSIGRLVSADLRASMGAARWAPVGPASLHARANVSADANWVAQDGLLLSPSTSSAVEINLLECKPFGGDFSRAPRPLLGRPTCTRLLIPAAVRSLRARERTPQPSGNRAASELASGGELFNLGELATSLPTRGSLGELVFCAGHSHVTRCLAIGLARHPRLVSCSRSRGHQDHQGQRRKRATCLCSCVARVSIISFIIARLRIHGRGGRLCLGRRTNKASEGLRQPRGTRVRRAPRDYTRLD